MTDTLAAPFSDTVVRLGVTGLSRAGKTVFITSLVANLLDRGRMPQVSAIGQGRVLAAYLQPQPDDTVPRFRYEEHMAALTAREPHWPDGTRRVSELRLSLKVAPTGLLAGVQGPRTVHIDIVDYPGEWLLDLSLLDKSYDAWSAEALERAKGRPEAAAFLALLEATDLTGPDSDEATMEALASAYAVYLRAAREAGYSDCTPGRFLLPGDLEGSPVLTFAPLPPGESPRRSLGREFARRFDSYKSNVVRPFFRDHFSRIDRQVVLVDVLGALSRGPRAMEDLRAAMADILGAFRPGRNAWLTSLFMGRRVEKILFAATKADHLHHTQHPQLAALVEALLREARDRADFSGAETRAMAIASLRTTVEETLDHQGRTLPVVKGRIEEGGRAMAIHPGDLPADPAHVLTPARSGAETWEGGGYSVQSFAPAPLTLAPGDGPPHIRLDRAVEFLIGDRL